VLWTHPLVWPIWSLMEMRVATPVERCFEWGYLFGALEVGGGASDFLYSPTVNKVADVHFLYQIAVCDEDAMCVGMSRKIFGGSRLELRSAVGALGQCRTVQPISGH